MKMTLSSVRVMRCHFMVVGLVMLCRLPMMAGSVFMMFSSLAVVFCSLF